MSRTKLMAIVLAVGLSNSAWSQVAENNDGFYVGAALGNFESEIDDIEDANFDFDADESAARIFAGWRFNGFVAIELGRYDFGEATNAADLLAISTDTKGWAPSIVGTLPVGPVEFFIRGGILFYDVEVNLDGGQLLDESGEDPVYAAGVGVTVLERLNLKLEYEVVEISEFADAEAVWLAGSWRF